MDNILSSTCAAVSSYRESQELLINIPQKVSFKLTETSWSGGLGDIGDDDGAVS